MPQVQGLGEWIGLVMDAPREDRMKGISMANEEPILNSPPTQDMAAHVQDYGKFVTLLKWGAIICLIVGLIWTMIVKAYW